MIVDRRLKESQIKPRRVLKFALAVLVALVAAIGCGTKPPPPPGAETETGPVEVNLGDNTESGSEAVEGLSHAGGSSDASTAPDEAAEKSDSSDESPDTSTDDSTEAKDN